MGWLGRCGLAFAAVLAVGMTEHGEATACTSARLAPPSKTSVVLRPTSRRGEHGYARGVPVRRLRGAHVVVHWATRGRDAPPRGDADDDRVPDYVETIAEVANGALAKYTANPGLAFREPLCDRAGPNANPDIYVKRMRLGLAIEATRADGGPFVMVARNLDTSTAMSRRSLRLIVAHELFHLVQFAYVARGMPRWVAEGAANAMGLFAGQARGDELTVDTVFVTQTDRWVRQPWIPLYDENASCTTCYGGGLWWLQALASLEQPRLIALYFERLAGTRVIGLGVDPLALTVQSVGWDFSQAFNRIATDLYRSGVRVAPRFVLDASAASGRTPDTRLFGMSTHYIPIRVPAGADGIDVTVEGLDGAAWIVRMNAGGPGGVDIRWAQPDNARVVFAPRFATDGRDLVLILTNAFATSARYAVSWQLR